MKYIDLEITDTYRLQSFRRPGATTDTYRVVDPTEQTILGSASYAGRPPVGFRGLSDVAGWRVLVLDSDSNGYHNVGCFDDEEEALSTLLNAVA